MAMELDVNSKWKILEEQFQGKFQKPLTLESILFLIGVRELGVAPREFSKEEKVDLMHIAICRLLSASGYYELNGTDQEGWPHWEALKPLPFQDMFSQVHLLRAHVIDYVEQEELFV